MTEHETVVLGSFCESLMQSEAFNALTTMFKKQGTDRILNSTPDAAQEREQTYTELQGLQKFLGLMLTLVSQRDQFVKRNDQDQSDATSPE